MMGKENFVCAHFAEKFQHPFGNSFQMSPYDLDIYATQGDIYINQVFLPVILKTSCNVNFLILNILYLFESHPIY